MNDFRSNCFGRYKTMANSQTALNYEAFIELGNELESENMGRTALLHDGEIVSIYDDKMEAYTVGCKKFGLGNFSIQTFGETSISLRFSSTSAPMK